MGRKPFPRNERCPYSSGDKYKRCCFTKGSHFYVDEETGEVLRPIPLNEEARSELEGVLAKQRKKVITKFRREPGLTSRSSRPLFFDLAEEAMRRDSVARDARRGNSARVDLSP